MEEFTNESQFWETVNQWVRDGSNITDVYSGPTGTVVGLIGNDGCREELSLTF